MVQLTRNKVREINRHNALIGDIEAEVRYAREKFPGDEVTFAALVEEVGELATALIEESSDRIRKEAIQVAAMAIRIVLDGDCSFDSIREKRNLDNIVND